jgi:threonine aldolase
MPYRIAGIDVHKKMLAVVVSDVETHSEFHFERRMFGGNPEQLRLLAAWLLAGCMATRTRGRGSSHGLACVALQPNGVERH